MQSQDFHHRPVVMGQPPCPYRVPGEASSPAPMESTGPKNGTQTSVPPDRNKATLPSPSDKVAEGACLNRL